MSRVGVSAMRADSADVRVNLQRLDDAVRDLVLQREDVGQVAVVAVRPQMRAVGGVDELRGDAHPVAGAADRALQHRRHAEVAPDVRTSMRLPL